MHISKPEVLMVSKPIAPPWHDSGKNLVRDISLGLSRYTPRLMTPGTQIEGLPVGVIEEPIYGQDGTYSPGLKQNALVFKRLLAKQGESIRHFFFAPNTKTSTVGRLVTKVHRRIPTIQTIMSIPIDFEKSPGLMFTDMVVALSQYTQDQLIDAGVPDVRLIYPGVDMTPQARASVGDRVAQIALRAELNLPVDRTIFTFAGDYQFSHASHVVASAIERLFDERNAKHHKDICVVFACRIKQAESRLIEQGIKSRLAPFLAPDRIVFLNEVPRILDLLAASDVVMLPADSTYAKMDIPLVLVEAMREERPVIVAGAGPLPEVIGHQDVGESVKVNCGESLAHQMMQYVLMPEKINRQGILARQRALDVFDARAMSPHYEALYDVLLSK